MNDLRRELSQTIKECAVETRKVDAALKPAMMSALAELITAAKTLERPISIRDIKLESDITEVTNEIREEISERIIKALGSEGHAIRTGGKLPPDNK